MQNQKRLTIGILAHVDAGKTTLSEAILYKTGVLRKFGRVDHGDAFLDFDAQEKDRGITIFAGQAEFTLPENPAQNVATDGTFVSSNNHVTDGTFVSSNNHVTGDMSVSSSDHVTGDVTASSGHAARVILLDTPGHVDFSAEMERTLRVLDYAVLVISGREGVQGHTATLWKLLSRYQIPTFIFINKMDIAGTDRQGILNDLKRRLSAGCFDFSDATTSRQESETLLEDMAMCDETLLEEYLESGTFTTSALAQAIRIRNIFPCYFGSALKLDGVDELLRGISTLTLGYGQAGTSAMPSNAVASNTVATATASTTPIASSIAPVATVTADGPLRTRIFRITRDKQGERLTHMKILSGTLHVRDILPLQGTDMPAEDKMPAAESNSDGGNPQTAGTYSDGEKVNQIRVYSGDKFRTVSEVGPGSICAVTGPANTRISDGSAKSGNPVGSSTCAQLRTLAQTGAQVQADTSERASSAPALEAVMTYSVTLPEGTNVHDAYIKLKTLEEEDPQLHITWNPHLEEIQIKLMGQVQLEVLHEIVKERFNIDVEFSGGHISYRETIAAPVIGTGHYEPLRHYAEVHLLLEPLPAGSGLEFGSRVSEDVLDRNWQRLIMTHLLEREHVGTLTGSPITDMRITIIAGRAHDKHTEGGDFRQATYRAIRQGLRKSLARGEMILLEPWYEFELEVPTAMIGRAMADIQRMGGQFDAPVIGGVPSNSGMQHTERTAPSAGMLQISGASEKTARRAETTVSAGNATLIGKVPVSEMKNYVTEVASYTKGYGHLNCSLAGYEPCHNQEKVYEQFAYEADRDIENTADSVFCSHGAGHNIAWDKADEMMHIPVQKLQAFIDITEDSKLGAGDVVTGRGTSGADPEGRDGSSYGITGGGSAGTLDEELQHIFEMTYGSGGKRKSDRHSNKEGSGGAGNSGGRGKKISIEAREFESELERRKKEAERRRRANEAAKREAKRNLPEFLLVDGYNIIFAWEELKELARVNIDSAREALIDILDNYQGYKKNHVVVVFDAYRVRGGQRHTEKQGNITVVYTAEAETADTYIERTTYEMSGKGGAAAVADSAIKPKPTALRDSVAVGSEATTRNHDIARGRQYRVRVATSDRLEQMIIMGNDAARVSANEFKSEVEQVNEEIAEFIKKLNRQNELDNPNKLQIP